MKSSHVLSLKLTVWDSVANFRQELPMFESLL